MRSKIITIIMDKIKKALCAGYLIGLAAEVYSRCQDVRIGAILFGLGLLTICTFKLYLFTGMVGEQHIWQCLDILFLNAIGVGVAILLLNFLPENLVLGIACGSLMQMGVSLYSKHPWATVLCVAAFLLNGFRHCIAILYSLGEPQFWSWTQASIFFCTVFGNVVGAKIVAFGGVVKGESND